MIWSGEGLLGLLGIVAPAMVLAIVVRRWVERVDWIFIVFCLLLAVIALGPPMYRNVLPIPVDEVARGYPYRGISGEPEVGNPVTNDTTRQMLPWMQLVRGSFARFEAPLWNPSNFAGYPLLGNGQSAPFSPFFLTTLFVPLPYQIISMAGLKFFVSMFFGILLFRREGFSDGAAMAGAAIFGLSVFQNVYLYYPMTAVTSLLPALLFFVSTVIDEPAKLSGRVGLALVTASILAGGHPESAFHCALGGAIFLGFKILGRGRRGLKLLGAILSAVAPAVIIGVLLSAPSWLPFAEQIMHSDRMATVSEHSMTPGRPHVELAVLGHPDRFGNPALGNWTGPANYCVVAPTYIGLVLLMLAVASLVFRGTGLRKRLYIAFGAACFVVALGWWPLSFVNRIPPMAWAANDRLRFVGVLFIALGSMHMLDSTKKNIRIPVGFGASFAIAVWWFSWGKEIETISRSTDLIGAAAVVVSALLLVAWSDRERRWIGWAAAALIMLEMLCLNRPFNASCDVAYFRPTLPIVEALFSHTTSAEPIRMVGRDWVLLPNASAHYGLEDVRGSDPMAWKPYLDFFDLVANPRRLHGTRRVTVFPQPGLDFLGVRYVLAEPGKRVPRGFETLYSGPDGELWMNPEALPRFFVPEFIKIACSRQEAFAGSAEIADFGRHVVVESCEPLSHSAAQIRIESWARRRTANYEIRLTVEESGLIASSIPAVPGWRLRVDGRNRKIIRLNAAFIGIPVEPGETRVELTYRPSSFNVAIGLCLIGMLTLALESRIRGCCRSKSPRIHE